MKKISALLAVFMFAFTFVNAQKNTATLISSNNNETIITFKTDDYQLKTVQTPNGKQQVVTAEEATQLMQANAPDLAKFTKSLIVSDTYKMQVEVVKSNYREIEIENNIAPSKGNLLRTVNPNDVPYNYGAVYSQDEFFPGKLADLNSPYIARDYRGQAVNVYPFQYNPVTKKLRIYTEITVKISTTGEIGENSLTRNQPLQKVSSDFKHIYNKHFINYNNFYRYTVVEEVGNILVICHDDWTSQMQPYVDWKNETGRPCEMVTASEAGGTATAIASYVEDYYNDNGLTFLLLVGDAAQVPTLDGPEGGGSDNSYAYITGNDHYLEFFVGRFSAETAAHVETQVERTINYEMGDELADGWLNVTTSIASSEGPGDDNEYDYEHARNMQTDLIGYTYVTPTVEIFDGSQGGNDASGDATPTQVSDAVNTGTGMITYTGHGDNQYWVTSSFSNSDIDNLTNNNKLPFIFDVACINGNFVGLTCFGEAWMRAENNGEPTGAIAICASTINQSWAPPMVGQDEMVDILVESYSNNIKRTFGGIHVNGMFLMNDETSDFDMTDTWTIFGDPAVYVRTDNPIEMTASNETIFVGTPFESTITDGSGAVEGAIVTISADGEYLSAVTNAAGEVSIDHPFQPGEVTFAVLAYNHVTIHKTVMVQALSGPYVTVADYVDVADYGTTFNLDLSLENVGLDPATGVTATVSCSDPNVTLTNTTYTYGDIAAETTTSPSSGAFTFEIADNVEDQYQVSFEVEITGSAKETWTQTKYITINAPEFEVAGMALSNDDDNNGRLDPGETADLSFTVNNTGHADANDVINALVGDSPYFSTLTNNLQINISAEGTADVTFEVFASEGTPEGTTVNLTLDVTKGSYFADYEDELIIGMPPEIIVGDGTEESGSYPFYTYYENNKTQMLYLGNELGAGEINIQEIAFDFSSLGSESEVQNLSIKFMETSIDEFGTSYEATTSATEVFYETTFTMPTSTGWFTFDTEDFLFDATINNLLIEIVWGDNGAWSSPHYVLNSTTTDFTSVAFGYADSETPPSYSDNSNVRPNTTFYFEGSAPGLSYDANFTVTDGSNPITNATVTVGSMGQDVDGAGQTTFNLYEGDYYYTVSAPGYATVSNQPFSIAGGNEDITVSMVVSDVNEIAKTVVDIYPNPTTGIINIDMPFENQEVEISVLDITGKIVLSEIANTSTTTVDLSNSQAGVYMLRIQTATETITQKIILK